MRKATPDIGGIYLRILPEPAANLVSVEMGEDVGTEKVIKGNLQ